MGLGQFADEPLRLVAAADYLRRHRGALTFTVEEFDPSSGDTVFELSGASLHAA
jgi:hypothetical protein